MNPRPTPEQVREAVTRIRATNPSQDLLILQALKDIRTLCS